MTAFWPVPLCGRAECHDVLIFPIFVIEEIQGVAELRPPEEVPTAFGGMPG